MRTRLLLKNGMHTEGRGLDAIGALGGTVTTSIHGNSSERLMTRLECLP
jgi:hypothetical protein